MIAPEEITTLSDLRGITPENLAAQGIPLLTLFNGLSPAHWKKIGSVAGLGREDLPTKLKPLFDILLPDQDPLYAVDRTAFDKRSVPLSPEQRAGARLHLAWSYEWWLAPLKESDKNFRAAFAGDSLPVADIYINRENDPKDTELTLFQQVTNKPKPSDLDVAALEGSVSLEGVFTVKELVSRIARASGVELYADARIEGLSVFLRGDRARTSDVLQALCLGIGGTIRRVGDAYLLTEERIPWFAQTVIHRELKERASELSDSARERLTQKLEKDGNALRAGIPALPGEPHPDTLSISSITEYNAPDIPPSLKRRIEELVEKTERGRATNERLPEGLKRDGVLVEPDIFLWLSLPDHGNLVNLGLDSSATGVVKEALLSKPEVVEEPEIPSELKKPVRWPARWSVRIVRIAPKTPEEAAIQAQAARVAGFTELWLDIPVGQQQAEALITTATKSGLPVTLVLSPLERPPGTAGDGFQSEILASGETTDDAWRRHNLNLPEGLEPDSKPEPRFLFPTESVITAVCELARVPGVKGIALRELARPGYVLQRGNDAQEGVEVEGGGFVLVWRQAFLRRWHVDPTDLVPPKSFGETIGIGEGIGSQLFGEHSETARKGWSVFRVQQAQRWRQLLHTRLRLTNPQARLFIQTKNSNIDDDNGVGFSPWLNGSLLPLVKPQNPYFTEFRVESTDSPEKIRWQLNALIRDDRNTRLLCDLTQVSSLPYLKELRQPPMATRKVESAGAGR
ncbi:MAG: hypothetical protein QM758_17120 [Armatimonas sp.]